MSFHSFMGFDAVIKSQNYMTRMMKLSMRLSIKDRFQKKKEKPISQIVNIYLDVIYCHYFTLHVFFVRKIFIKGFYKKISIKNPKTLRNY